MITYHIKAILTIKMDTMKYNIPIYKPSLSQYKKSAMDAIESEWISNHGKYIELATNKLKEILNVEYVILMMNGTTATHCLFIALKYKFPQIDTIYVPNNVYVAAYNTVLMEYEIRHIEVMKIDTETLNMDMDENYIQNLKQNSAILIVHNLGNIINVEKIHQLRPDIILIEDNCEGLFGKYNEIYSGTSKSILCSSVSFYGNKTITSGEGGAFITQNKDVYDHIKKVYSQGMSDIKYIHNVHAYNYRMTNIQAGFLYDQLNDLENILIKKRKLFDYYDKLLLNLINNNEVKLQKIEENTVRANWIYSLRILNNKYDINYTFDFFKKYGIEIRPFFYPYISHQHLENIKSHEKLDQSFRLNQSIILIPSYPEITYDEQDYIVSIIYKFINHLKK